MNPRNYDTVYPEARVDTPPEIEGGMSAFYERTLENHPPAHLRQGTNGRTTIVLVVSPEGEPTNVFVSESHYPAVDRSIRSVVLDSSFTPGQHNGKAVPVAMKISVRTTETSSISIR